MSDPIGRTPRRPATEAEGAKFTGEVEGACTVRPGLPKLASRVRDGGIQLGQDTRPPDDDSGPYTEPNLKPLRGISGLNQGLRRIQFLLQDLPDARPALMPEATQDTTQDATQDAAQDTTQAPAHAHSSAPPVAK